MKDMALQLRRPRKRPMAANFLKSTVHRPKVPVAVHAAKAVFAVPRWYTRYPVVDTHPIHTADAFYATKAYNYGANTVAIICMSKFVERYARQVRQSYKSPWTSRKQSESFLRPFPPHGGDLNLRAPCSPGRTSYRPTFISATDRLLA